jgi:CHAD domain-containing protein
VPVYLESVAESDPPTGVEIPNDEPLPLGLRRVMIAQIDRVIDAVTTKEDHDPAVHEARKAMKRIRSLLRLVRDEIGDDIYRNENAVFRDVGRALAPPRDALVVIDTLTSVVHRHSSLIAPDAFRDTLALLDIDHRRIRRSVIDDRQLMSDLFITLKAARTRFGGGRPVDRPAAPTVRDDFAGIAGGLHRVYHRGRKALPEPGAHPSTEELHRWRKQVKYLRYQLETLTPLWPEVVGAEAQRLSDLGEVLGHDHDLAALVATIDGSPHLCPDPAARAMLSALVAELRKEALLEAVELGAASYGETPRGFVSRYEGYWNAARSR